MSSTQPAAPDPVAARPPVTAVLVGRWLAVRAELRRRERAEHRDLVDKFGRAWIWRDGDLYTHDKMAWTRAMIEGSACGLPTPAALANPNYDFCPICARGPAQ